MGETQFWKEWELKDKCKGKGKGKGKFHGCDICTD
jgi:hypothetical protein